MNERCDEHRNRHQNYHREDINGGWVDPPRAKIPNEVRNRKHPKWNADNQHYREQGGAPRGTGLNNLFVHFTELASFPISVLRLEHRELALHECIAVPSER